MVVVVIGIVLVVAGVVGFVLAHRERSAVHAMIGAETLPVAELAQLHGTAVEVAGPGGFRRLCEVVGTAVPGPGGLLEAELSRTKCVWHRHRVQRRYRHVSHDSHGRRQVSQRTETVADLTSGQPFGVQDATGVVLVQPQDSTVDAPEQVVSRFEPHQGGRGDLQLFGMRLQGWGRDDTIGYEYAEWVLRQGVRLYVHGEASDRSGGLAFCRPERGPYFVSTRTEEELRRTHTTRQKLFAFGGVGAVLVGLALVVGGLL